MKTPEHHDDLFQSSDARAQEAAGEMRFRADEVVCEGSSQPRAAADVGARLKAARESRGMTIEQCGQALRLPARVLQRLEAGDFGDAGQYVFTRGAINSYARLLGVPTIAAETALRSPAPAQLPILAATGSTSRGRFLLQRYGAAATYFILTATVAVPLVWLGLRGGLDNQLTRIAPLDSAPVASVAQTAQPPHTQSDQAPLLASMTPFAAMNLDDTSTPAPDADTATQGHVLTLHATADSWVEVVNAGGDTLESGMLHAGDQRSYRSTTPLNVTLGNANAVDVTRDGKPMPTDAFRHANIARFEVFGSGGGNG